MKTTTPTAVERIKKATLLGLCKLPLPVIKRLAGKPIEIDGYKLDPHYQFLSRYISHKPGHIPAIADERREFDLLGNWLAPPMPADIHIDTAVIDGPNGDILCEIHRHTRTTANPNPALIYFHGGGHVAGSTESHRELCRHFADQAKCTVISVDYRLAPEHPFPIGINDCLTAYDSVVNRAEALRIDKTCIAIGGDSAGANITAVVAQQRKTAPHPPVFQMLLVPWLDMSCQRPSYNTMGRGFFLEKVKMAFYTQQYLKTEGDAKNPLASPLLGDVDGVCPAGLFIAGFDPLRDEGLAYAKRLQQAGVETQVHFYEGAIHPFFNLFGKTPLAAKAFSDAVTLLKRALQTP